MQIGLLNNTIIKRLVALTKKKIEINRENYSITCWLPRLYRKKRYTANLELN